MATLSTIHRCIGINLKGYGQSEKRAGDYRHEGAAEQMYAMLQLTGVHKFNLTTHDRGTAQAGFIAANHPDAVLRYARGEQHLYHVNRILAPQGDTFRDTAWTGLMEDLKRFVIFVYTWISKIVIPDEEMARVIQEFSYPETVRVVSRYFNSSTFRQE
jgi:pimeloyl-ACP methyl ester carboxylesterase